MQTLMGYARRAIEHYRMLENGDRLLVGVSGGKDSVALLGALAGMRRYLGVDYTLHAVTLDPCFDGEETDYSPIAAYCKTLGVPYTVQRTDIGEIVFSAREEKNPCSLCARMRRGAIHDTALALGCNKLAFGHHRDDAVETFLMNLFIEGRVGCFSPVTYLSRKELTLIRPFIYLPEAEIRRAVRRLELPVVKNRCPVDGHTRREEMKRWIAQKEREDKGFTERVFGALCRSGKDGW